MASKPWGEQPLKGSPRADRTGGREKRCVEGKWEYRLPAICRLLRPLPYHKPGGHRALARAAVIAGARRINDRRLARVGRFAILGVLRDMGTPARNGRATGNRGRLAQADGEGEGEEQHGAGKAGKVGASEVGEQPLTSGTARRRKSKRTQATHEPSFKCNFIRKEQTEAYLYTSRRPCSKARQGEACDSASWTQISRSAVRR